MPGIQSPQESESAEKRGKFCQPNNFQWMATEEKLMNDCDNLKNETKINVKLLTEKSECITVLYVSMMGLSMPEWQNPGQVKPEEVIIKNTLPKAYKLQAKKQIFSMITVTARNPQMGHEKDHKVQFKVDARHCKEAKSTKTSEEHSDDTILIFVCTSLLLLALVVVCILVWKKKKGMSGSKEDEMDTDENHTYGTYSRGWGEDGEYGDGDKVYVTDSNDYYATND